MNQFTHHQIKAVPENVERGRMENNHILKTVEAILEQIQHVAESEDAHQTVETLKQCRKVFKSEGGE